MLLSVITVAVYYFSVTRNAHAETVDPVAIKIVKAAEATATETSSKFDYEISTKAPVNNSALVATASPTPTETPVPTETPTPTEEPTQTPVKTETRTEEPVSETTEEEVITPSPKFTGDEGEVFEADVHEFTDPPGVLDGITIGLNAAHFDGDQTQAVGADSKIPEYEITMDVALRLQDMLIKEGAKVILTQEAIEFDGRNSIDISKADIYLSLHAGCFGLSKHGVSLYIPYINYDFSDYEIEFGETIYKHLLAYSHLRNNGLVNINGVWRDKFPIPVYIINLGVLSNLNDDVALSDETYRANCAFGLFEGILACDF
jgi:N-acetylmuramoyl-L-alanine amidase